MVSQQNIQLMRRSIVAPSYFYAVDCDLRTFHNDITAPDIFDKPNPFTRNSHQVAAPLGPPIQNYGVELPPSFVRLGAIIEKRVHQVSFRRHIRIAIHAFFESLHYRILRFLFLLISSSIS
jgi:hypothetical protein